MTEIIINSGYVTFKISILYFGDSQSHIWHHFIQDTILFVLNKDGISTGSADNSCFYTQNTIKL